MRPKTCFAAAFAEREDFSRVQRTFGIEGVVDTAHEVEVGVGEKKRHQLALFHADAVLSGKTAANFDAVANDFGGGFEGALELLVVAKIVEDDRMKVAVAGVEDVADAESELIADLLDAAQCLRELGARDDAVEHVDAGGDASECAEGIFAALPEEFALFFVAGDPDFPSVVIAADFVDGGGLRGDGLEHAFDFEEQYGGGIEREAGVDVIFDDAKSPAVEHFAGGGSDAASGDVGDGFGGVVDGVEDGEERFDGFGLARKFDGDFGDERERTLGADEEAGEVVRGRVALLAADADDFAVGENEFERGDVICGYAVGERVRAAGVFGDVAADGGGFLAGRVGREIEAGVLDRAGDVEIDDAGLDDGALIFEIDFEDAIHAREDEHESAGAGECAAGESGAGAAAEDRGVVSGGEFYDLGDFGGRGREDDGVGAAFFDRAVIFVEDEIFGAVQDGVGSEKPLQRADEVAIRLRFGG
jgi:hypothetical protein